MTPYDRDFIYGRPLRNLLRVLSSRCHGVGPQLLERDDEDVTRAVDNIKKLDHSIIIEDIILHLKIVKLFKNCSESIWTWQGRARRGWPRPC